MLLVITNLYSVFVVGDLPQKKWFQGANSRTLSWFFPADFSFLQIFPPILRLPSWHNDILSHWIGLREHILTGNMALTPNMAVSGLKILIIVISIFSSVTTTSGPAPLALYSDLPALLPPLPGQGAEGLWCQKPQLKPNLHMIHNLSYVCNSIYNTLQYTKTYLCVYYICTIILTHILTPYRS